MHNTNKGVYKVERTCGVKATSAGPWVAMLSSDDIGTEYFYGEESECRSFIDAQRAEWAAAGKELVHQSSSVLVLAKAA